MSTLLKLRVSGTPTAGDFARMQDNVAAAYDGLTSFPLLGAVTLKDVDLTTSATQVEHGLGRAWSGWLITTRNADARVWVSAETLSERFLTLTASASVTVDLLVW